MNDALQQLVTAPGVDQDVFAILAHVEFQVRTLGLLSAAVATERIRLPNPGSLDTWAALAKLNLPDCTECRKATSKVLDSAELEIAPGLDLRSVRNTVFHGGPVPADLDVAVLRRIVDENARSVVQVLGHGHAERLEPFIIQMDGAAYALNSFDEISATYWPRAGSAIDIADGALIAELRRRVDQSADRLLAAYAADIERDLRGFAEEGSARVFVSQPGVVVAHWEHRATQTSDPRSDHFEIGIGGERRWRDPSGTKSYSEFLKSISNWSVLKRRLRSDLLQQLDRETRISRELFGDALLHAARVEAKVHIVANGSGEETSEITGVSEALGRIVAQTDIYCGATNLVTLAGEAGSGKTHTLLQFAKESLDESEALDSSPIVVFISSSGKSAASVRDLIDARVATTRILDGVSVLALCRSGLAILVVDGFDELLGFRSYDDPLAGLRPILDELRGRGTVLLSARSSYFEARLRNSLTVQNSMSWPPSVSTLELVGWTQAELAQLVDSIEGVNAAAVTAADMRLLTTPFFCLAYVGWLQTGGSERSFLGYVVSRYLERERAKLLGDGGAEMFSADVLESLFCELAELSAKSHWSDISEDDLLLAGAAAAGRDLLPQEARRLVALCGMSAEWSESALSFAFTHSALAEYFLALQVCRQSTQRAVSILGSVELSPLAAGLVDTLGSDPGQNSIDALLAATQAIAVVDRSPFMRLSLGSLWARRHGSTTEDRSAQGFTTEELVLDGAGLVTMTDCTIDTLTIKGAIRLRLERSKVGRLDISDVGLDSVSGPVWDQVLELVTRRELATGASRIRRVLRPGEAADQSHTETVEQDQFYSANLELRTVPVVMTEKEWSTDDDRVAWTKTYGDEAWVRFVKSLLSDGKATLDTLNASGKAKVRLRLTQRFHDSRAASSSLT